MNKKRFGPMPDWLRDALTQPQPFELEEIRLTTPTGPVVMSKPVTELEHLPLCVREPSFRED